MRRAPICSPKRSALRWAGDLAVFCLQLSRIGATAPRTGPRRPMIISSPWTAGFTTTWCSRSKTVPWIFRFANRFPPLRRHGKDKPRCWSFKLPRNIRGSKRISAFWCPSGRKYWISIPMPRGKGRRSRPLSAVRSFRIAIAESSGCPMWGMTPIGPAITLAQANWYGFGRLSWNPDLSAEEIAEEWVRLTFGHDPQVVEMICGSVGVLAHL